MTRGFACAALLFLLLPGCAGPGEDDLRTVRLELVNQTGFAVSGWLRAEQADGAILLQRQWLAAAGTTEVHEALVVVETLDHFLARMSGTGDDMQTVSRPFDPETCVGDPVHFRVVSTSGLTGVRHDATVRCG